MRIIICDICGKRADDNALNISVSGWLETKERSGMEYSNNSVCSKCYVQFKKQFTKVLSPFLKKEKKLTKK